MSFRFLQLFSALVLFGVAVAVAGCSNVDFGDSLVPSLQRKTIFARPSDAFVEIVDSTGASVEMSDGIKVVMDNQTFETLVVPKL